MQEKSAGHRKGNRQHASNHPFKAADFAFDLGSQCGDFALDLCAQQIDCRVHAGNSVIEHIETVVNRSGLLRSFASFGFGAFAAFNAA